MNHMPLEIINGRACSPTETFERVSPHLSRLGVTRVSRQTDLDKIGISVWCAYSPNAKSIVIAQGKGLDDNAARTSAVMEAIERSVATEPSCELITESQGSLRAKGQIINTLESLLEARGAVIQPDEEIVWARASDLVTGKPLWVPFDAVHLDRTAIAPRYWLSSDGLASGNTREEAVLHGLLERVERDALTLWEVTPAVQRYQRRIDTANIANAELAELLAKINKADMDVALFDITTDLDIPCVVALLGPNHKGRHPSLRHVDITLGAGASTLPTIAAIRAVTEAAQSRMTFIAGARDDLLPSVFEDTIASSTLSAFEAVPSRDLAGLPTLKAGAAESTLSVVLRQLQMRGITEIYAVDLSPDWLPANVVKIFAPQLENPNGNRRQRYGSRALSKVL